MTYKLSEHHSPVYYLFKLQSNKNESKKISSNKQPAIGLPRFTIHTHTQKETKIIQLPAQDFFHSFPVLAPEAVEGFVGFDSA